MGAGARGRERALDEWWRSIDRDGKCVDGGGGKLMGSEDEVVGCIVEGKVKGDGEQLARQPIIMQCKE